MKKSSIMLSKASRPSTKVKNLDTIVAGTTAVSAVLTTWFVFSVFASGQNLIQNDVLNAPNVYAAWIALLLGGYSWANTRSTGVKQVVIGTFVALTTALVIWIFGMTGAGVYLGY